MLAHAISRTTAVTPKSMASGFLASSCIELCPRAPGASEIGLARNRSRVAALMPFWSGASTSLTMAW